MLPACLSFFFFNDTATTEIYTLSLHDALPISLRQAGALIVGKTVSTEFAYFEPGPTRNPHNLAHTPGGSRVGDRKSTRLNSSHQIISYAVFCLKKKKNEHTV